MLTLKYVWSGIAVVAACLLATDSLTIVQLIYRDFAGKYLLYGGYQDDMVAPVTGDNKIAFEIRDSSAKCCLT